MERILFDKERWSYVFAILRRTNFRYFLPVAAKKKSMAHQHNNQQISFFIAPISTFKPLVRNVWCGPWTLLVFYQKYWIC